MECPTTSTLLIRFPHFHIPLHQLLDFLQTVMFTLFGNYEPLEEHLLLTMFENALKMEFSNSNDLGSLMRNNTAISRMMTTYTRRGLGQQYLKDVLVPQVVWGVMGG